jgi:hypothetical protein
VARSPFDVVAKLLDALTARGMVSARLCGQPDFYAAARVAGQLAGAEALYLL